jgi:predicted nucleic acid-binding protein
LPRFSEKGLHLLKVDSPTHLFVEPHHYRLARDWIGLFHTNLRTLDALHLAIAHAEGLTFVTADQELAESVKVLALDVMVLKK